MKIVIRRLTLLALLCLVNTFGFARITKLDSLSIRVVDVETQLHVERQAISILQKEVEINEKSLRCIEEHVDRVNEEISNQIASSSHTIQVWGWIFTVLAILVSIAGILFAYYIHKTSKDMSRLTSEAAEQLKQAEEQSNDINEMQQRTMSQQSEIKKALLEIENQKHELQKLYSDIQKNSQRIYTSMRREETTALLIRLEEIPEDIVNISKTLFTRNLSDADFTKLLNAYSNLIARSKELSNISTTAELRTKDFEFASLENSYMLLFAQHFMGKSILKEEIRESLRSRFFLLFNECFFRNDAEKSTKDFKQGILNLSDEKLQMDLMKEFVEAIIQSRYQKLTELYDILLSGWTELQLREIWEAVTKKQIDALPFANVIQTVVTNLNPQSTLLEAIAGYINRTTADVEATK